MTLLVAVPVKADLHPILRETSARLADAIAASPANRAAFGAVEIAYHVDDGSDLQPIPANIGRFREPARARNNLLALHLKPHHDFVFWLDADIVHLAAEMPSWLYAANPGGVTAPMVLIDGTQRFYDTQGFVQDGMSLREWYPYFRHQPSLVTGDIMPLDSVGCVYLIPASVCREQPYYSPRLMGSEHHSIRRTGHTDHWPVMYRAREKGLLVAALSSAYAYHADLTHFGEAWH